MRKSCPMKRPLWSKSMHEVAVKVVGPGQKINAQKSKVNRSLSIGCDGDTSFYAKIVLAKFGVLCKIGTPRSDPSKGGLPMWKCCRSGPESNSQREGQKYNRTLISWPGHPDSDV